MIITGVKSELGKYNGILLVRVQTHIMWGLQEYPVIDPNVPYLRDVEDMTKRELTQAVMMLRYAVLDPINWMIDGYRDVVDDGGKLIRRFRYLRL